MARSQETFNKKDVRNKKEKKRKDKEKKRLERKDGTRSGSPDDMIAYVDEYGNITSTPPDTTVKKVIDLDDIRISIPKKELLEKVDPIRKGKVTFFNDSKGYGFIKDAESQESVFVHANNLLDQIKENDIVNFELEKTQKGAAAVRVKLFKAEKPAPVQKEPVSEKPEEPAQE